MKWKTLSRQAAEDWFNSPPVNPDWSPTISRQEYIDDMVNRLAGHLEPYFKLQRQQVVDIVLAEVAETILKNK